MKLHLPSPLRKALLAVIAAAGCVAGQAAASSTSTFVSMSVYTDFGDNAGLYSTHGVNDLLTKLRKEEGGIFIYYTEESGIPKYNILQNEDQPLISFESRMDSGPGAAVSYNILATVEHNGVLDPTFTASKIGGDNAIHYYGIEYRKSGSTAQGAPFADLNTFRLVPRTDFKITRLSKVVTDVATYDFNTAPASTYKDQLWYRSGSGAMYRVGEDGVNQRWGGAYAYNVGGLMTIASSSDYDHYGEIADYRGVKDTSGSVLTTYRWWSKENIASQSFLQPLPFAIQAGDSGSPTWLYDPETKTYLYSGAMQSANGSTLSQARYAGEWAKETEKYFNVDIDLEGNETITINAATKAEPGKYDPTNNVTSKPFSGTVQISGKSDNLSYIGVNSQVGTWKSLSGKKDELNWYAYGKEYMNDALTYADLFYTQNLVFNGKSGQKHEIVINGKVDTGIGYALFSKADTENTGRVSYTISGDSASMFNTAGFVVEKDVDLHIKLTGQANNAREWRKIGEGNLYIEGSGNNNEILLNLGGSGTTYLKRTEGYAAYNVLANNGTRVVIDNTQQIERDFTFGYGGATLDMNGLEMIWNNSNNAGDAGFTIHALTDEARITNAKAGSVTRLTWTEGGTKEYLGSFVDTKDGGALQFIYQGSGENARLTLHSIYTDLHNTVGSDKSGIIVNSGTLALQGTVTQHAPGSLGAQFSSARLVNNDDWHYADMTTPVTVNGGTFELGSHARLTGNVTVENGGKFVMREGVTHQMEYLEGGYTAKDTDKYRDYFGLKGDVVLKDGSAMEIKFNDAADSTLVYGGSISGTGSLTVDSGIIGGMVALSGDNMGHTGAKTVQRGGMMVTDVKALGNVEQESGKWRLTDSGFLVVDKAFAGKSHSDILKYIHSGSDGILALTEKEEEAYVLDGHKNIIIGAAKDCTVEYGKSTESLAAQAYGADKTGTDADGYWRFGGGGGEIQVLSRLSGNNDLILGAQYAKGSVYLANENNDFSGTIVFNGGVTLKYENDSALGSANININYTNRIAVVGTLDKVLPESKGVVLIDKIKNQNLDLTKYADVAVGSEGNVTYSGAITVDTDAAYNFGGSTGVLTIDTVLAARGTNNLNIDGQNFNGGEIRLDRAAEITGAVTVRGCDVKKATQKIDDTGDITLGLGTDNALQYAGATTLMRGGYLDLHGTSQKLTDLAVDAGGAVFSSGVTPSSLDVLLSQGRTWSGSVQSDKITVSKVSDNVTLTLSGTTDYSEMRINSGVTVSLGANNALAPLGTTYISNGATLQTNGSSSAGNIVVESGGRLRSDTPGSRFSGFVTMESGGSIYFKDNATLTGESTLVANGGTIEGHNVNLNGYTLIQGNTTLYGGSQEGGVNIGGQLEIANDCTLKLQEYYNNDLALFNIVVWCSYGISSADINTAERRNEAGDIIENTGKLQVHAYELKLTGADQEIGGILELVNGFNSRETYLHATSGTKTVNRLQVNTSAAIIEATNQQKNHLDSAANWVIHHLEGSSGDITTNLVKGNYVLVDDSGTFNRKFTMKGGTLGLAHSQALGQAEVVLTGGASLALDAAESQVRGLSSSDSATLVYAGAIGSAGSVRDADLVINTDDKPYTYAGSVSSTESVGVSLVKSGSGTQNFSGNSVVVQNVTVKEGNLGFTGSTAPTIYGDVSIAGGATLNLGSHDLVLGAGQELRALPGNDGNNLAKLEGGLQLAGGSLSFSGASISESASLNVTGNIAYQGDTQSLSVLFTGERELDTQKAYVLSSGNWSAVDGKVVAEPMIYYDAHFTADGQKLAVTFTDRTDIQVWNGENGKSGWNDQTFGNETNNLTQGSTAVFNDDAASANVSITSNVEVKELVFDNDENTYRLVTGAGAGVQADKLRQVGDSSTELTGNFHAAAADVEAGTLSLGRGSSVDTVNVAESATVVLKDADRQPETISGDGTVRVDWGAENTQALNIGRIGVVEVESGHVDMTGQDSVSMNVLHVKENTSFAVTAQAGNFADKAIVDKDGRLETSISAFGTSGLVTELSGAGTVSLTNSREVDLGDHEVSGGRVDASAFTGTLELGNGEQKMRFRSSNVTGLGQGATIEVADKSQYWVTDNNCVVNANLLLHGDSGAAKGNSWKNEGFGAVRGAKVVNGDVIIDGNAMLSGNDQKNITFNGAVKSYNDSGEDTMTLGCYYSNGAMTYTFAEGSDASGLDNIVLRRSGGAGTGQGSILNIESDKGLARNVQFYAGTTDGAQVNINAAATADTLKSAAGDGVVNIAEGKSLELTRGQVYGGSIHLGDGVAVTAAEGQVATVQDRVTYGVDGAASASISGTGATRMENAAIDLAEGSRLVMENITLSTNSTVTEETAAAALAAKSLKLEAKVGENLMRRESVAARMQPLTYGLDMPQPKMAAAAADDVVSFTLQNVSGIAMEGEQLLISMVGSNGAFDSYDWVGISLAENGTFDDNLAVTLLYTDAEGAQRSVNGVYTLEDAETAALAAAEPHGMVYFHLAGAAGVPEPASSTLSLLALAALAARRRRKG